MAALTAVLSDDERGRAERFRFEPGRCQFTAARAALRCILAAYLDKSPTALTFGYGERGKPFLPERPVRFNLSHSGDWALCALCLNHAVGVDIEFMRADRELDKLARRFFASSEAEALAALPETQRVQGFYNCWTRKEAYIKACGDGLWRALDQFRVTLDPAQAPALVWTEGDPGEAAQWTVVALDPAPGYAAALATRARVTTLRLAEWPLEDIDRWMP